jgi:GT2 family glycosyltransferase
MEITRGGAAPRVTVVIPTFNGEKFLPGCLDALARQRFVSFRVVVVDNGSTDSSLAILAERYPAVSVILMGRNTGFAPAVNAGIRGSDTELVALLNNDAEPSPEWLGELVSALDADPGAGFCASKMVDSRDPRTIESAGDCYASNGRSLPRGFLERDIGQYDTPAEVFGACAGAALYRRSLFDRVGLFDERLVSYKEDVDLDFRAWLAGIRCIYVPSAVCRHIGGATSGGRKSDLALRLGTRNGVILFFKNMPRPLLPRTLPRLLLDLSLQFGHQALKGGRAIPLARGILGAAAMMPHALRERRAIQGRAKPDIGRLRRLLREGDEEVRRHRARCRARGE